MKHRRQKSEAKKTGTLRGRVFISLFSVVLLQSVFLLVGILLTGIVTNLNSSLKTSFQETVSDTGIYIEKLLVEYGDLDVLENSVKDVVSQLAAQEGMAVSEYVSVSGNGKAILDELPEDLLTCLRSHRVNSCFVILENPESDTNKYAMVLDDYDPTSSQENNHDIMVEAGSGRLLFEKGFTLDASWTEKLTIDSDADFYYKVLEAGNTYSDIESVDLGYYSCMFQFHKGGMKLLGYTRPLLDENHHAYGVIGVGISQEYLQGLLAGRSMGITGDGTYYVGITEDGISFQTVASEGKAHQSEYRYGTSIVLQEKSDLWNVCFDGAKTSQLMTYYTSKLYNSNTPFEQEQWIVGGIVDWKVLYRESIELTRSMALSILLAVIVCIIGAFFMVNSMEQPIRILFRGLESNNSWNRLKLPRTTIREFDELAEKIEEQSDLIYREASKVSDIVHMADVQMGVLEIRKNSEAVFCTDQFLKIFELPFDGWKDNHIDKKVYGDIEAFLRERLIPEPEENDIYRYTMKDGTERYLHVSRKEEEDSILYVVIDETHSMQEKQVIRHERDFDKLTNLCNRWSFTKKIEEKLENHEIRTGVFTMWDLDKLKFINDTYGHDVGDRYIINMADVLKAAQSENCIVARRSGDEFMMFCFNDSVESLMEFTRNVHARASRQRIYLPDGKDMPVNVSAGMALYPSDTDDLQQLMLYADFAMYEVKQNDRGTVRLFNRESYMRGSLALLGIGELTRILEEESVRYEFQPIMDLQSDTIFGYEALMRPESEVFKTPAELLSIAQSQSRLSQLERITWFGAIREFSRFAQADEENRLFINSIPNQWLSNEDLEQLEQMPHHLFTHMIVEISENANLREEMNYSKYEWCEKHGVSIALDDFGTGYRNADALMEKHFTYVKMKSNIVKQLTERSDIRELITGLVVYCHKNGKKVMAKGVETEEEFRIVKEVGFDYAQGWYISEKAFPGTNGE